MTFKPQPLPQLRVDKRYVTGLLLLYVGGVPNELFVNVGNVILDIVSTEGVVGQ